MPVKTPGSRLSLGLGRDDGRGFPGINTYVDDKKASRLKGEGYKAKIEKIALGQFALSGVVNFESAPVLWIESRKLFSSVKSDRIELDLSRVEQLDTAILALLMQWFRYLKSKKKTLCLSHVSEHLLSIIRLCNLESILLVKAVV